MPSLLGKLTRSVSQGANRRGLYMGKRINRVYVPVYRLTGGRVGGHLPGWPQARVLLLRHTGARSGEARVSPAMYHALPGGAVAIAASKAGQPTNPAWFHNLRAHPDAEVEIGSERRAVSARTATPEERRRLWPEFVAFYPGYEFFREGAGDREIPIVILEPR